MADQAAASAPLPPNRRDWPGAFRALRRLLSDPNDTHAVFHIMRALNGDTARKNYRRLLSTLEGGRIAYRRPELIDKLMDREFLGRFEPGTVGAAYRAFLDKTGYSADGLAAVGRDVHGAQHVEHPYAWFGRRERDLHDIWHTLTGYKADDPLGELCLVAFSYAQTGGLGWGFIALAGMLKSVRVDKGALVRRAVREGYAHGRAASWLHLEDIDRLFAEPLDAARQRLNIAPPAAYAHAQRAFGAVAATPAAVAA